MSENERLQIEKEIEQRVEERVNVRELKKIRYQLETMNRSNEQSHVIFDKAILNLSYKINEAETDIKEIKNKTWWTMLIDWLAQIIKKKETILIPLGMGLLAWWRQLYELVITIFNAN